MINIIENHYKEPDKNTAYKTICPHCKSVFTFGLEDLKFIEKTLDGKRVINCPCCGADFDTTKAQTDEVKGDKTCCEFCTSHACCGLTSEAAGGCEHAKNTIIGKVGIVTKTPDGKTRIPFYTGKIDGIGEIRFVTK